MRALSCSLDLFRIDGVYNCISTRRSWSRINADGIFVEGHVIYTVIFTNITITMIIIILYLTTITFVIIVIVIIISIIIVIIFMYVYIYIYI